MSGRNGQRRVIVLGGGFAGLACAERLGRHPELRVTLIDRHNYHQFQPLLYQVATSQLGPGDVAFSLRKVFREHPAVDVKLADVVRIDPLARTVEAADGSAWEADTLVLAAGSVPNFFGTPGADRHSFPLYSLDDAERLRSRIIAVFEDADRDPSRVDAGALDFVVVGGGPTGVETAGALADLVRQTMTVEYRDLPVERTRIHLIDLGHALLGPFSPRAHAYAARELRGRGVDIRLGVAVEEIGAGHVRLSDGTTIATRCVVWGGGITAPPLAGADGLPHGRGGRIDVAEDLTVPGAPGVYAIGDVANLRGRDGAALPQLGSVALQSGTHAADNILAELRGEPRAPFRYRDKGIMAMIGRGSAIAAFGSRPVEIHGLPAFVAWLGVHALLMTGVRTRTEAVLDWLWSYFSRTRGPQVLDRTRVAVIDWAEDDQTPGLHARSPA